MARVGTSSNILDSDGNIIDLFAKPLDGYEIANKDENIGAVSYYGYVDLEGSWFIQREDEPNGTTTFAAGTTDYSTNWTNRASLSYDRFDNVF